MCCAPQQANHLDSEEEDPFERIEDVYDMVESDLELTEEEETIRILEQELARVRRDNEWQLGHIRFLTFMVTVAVIVMYVTMWFGPPPTPCPAPAPVAECPTIPECPPVPQCADKKSEDLRLCPGEQRVRVLMKAVVDDQRGFQVKDRVVTEIEEWTISKPPVLKVGHEIVFVDGVNVEEKTDEEIRAMIWTDGAFIQTDIVVRNATKFDYVKEVCFFMELGTVLCLIFCFIVNVLEPAVWARDEKAINDKKQHSAKDGTTESAKIEDQQEYASDTINAQKVAIEDNRVELEMYEARLAAIKSEFEILENRLKALAEKTAEVDEVEQASLNELDKLEKTLNECFPRSSEDEEEPKAGVITRSHKRLSRSNGMFLDAPSLLA